jgi:predicted nucleic acid-binding protein
MDAILADTGPLYAAADPSDQYHHRAQKETKLLEKRGTAVWISYPTLLETYTLVLRRLGSRSAHFWLDEVQAGAGLINPTPRDYSEAIRHTYDYPDQPLTLFDTLLAALSARLGLPVWTYDHHFEIMRVQLWR